MKIILEGIRDQFAQRVPKDCEVPSDGFCVVRWNEF
jgi:hypothetical protein